MTRIRHHSSPLEILFEIFGMMYRIFWITFSISDHSFYVGERNGMECPSFRLPQCLYSNKRSLYVSYSLLNCIDFQFYFVLDLHFTINIIYLAPLNVIWQHYTFSLHQVTLECISLVQCKSGWNIQKFKICTQWLSRSLLLKSRPTIYIISLIYISAENCEM